MVATTGAEGYERTVGSEVGHIRLGYVWTALDIIRWVRTLMDEEIYFEVLDDDTDHPVVTARIMVGNREIMVMADVSQSNDGTELRLRGLHMHGDGAQTLGVRRLRTIAEKVM